MLNFELKPFNIELKPIIFDIKPFNFKLEMRDLSAEINNMSVMSAIKKADNVGVKKKMKNEGLNERV